MERHLTRMNEMEIASTLVDKAENVVRRSCEKPRSGYEDNIKMDRKTDRSKQGLVQCFSTRVVRNRRVSKNIVRGSTINRVINIRTF